MDARNEPCLEMKSNPQTMMNSKNKGRVEIVNTVLQSIGVFFATLFGIFSILAWQSAASQVKQAEFANQLTLLSYCASSAPSVRKLLAKISCFE